MNNNKILFANLLGQSLDKKLYREDVSLVSNSDAIGVEVELENIRYFETTKNLPNIFDLWNAVEDGSLRDGTEFIFKEPLKGANISAALELMNEFLKLYRKKGKPVLITERCSVHIHLDIRDLDEHQLNNMIMVYLLIERVLFYHINPLRLKNNYCRPLTDSDFKYTLKSMLNISKDNDIYSIFNAVKKECDKYSALNVLPITTFGSVEFRHHHGTSDMMAIKNWINIILAIKRTSIKYSIEDLLDLNYEKGFIKLLSVIFDGTDLGNEEYLSSLIELERLVDKGIIDVKEILDYDKLQALTSKTTRTKSRVRPENTLLHQFKKANGLLSEQIDISKSEKNSTITYTPVSFNDFLAS